MDRIIDRCAGLDVHSVPNEARDQWKEVVMVET